MHIIRDNVGHEGNGSFMKDTSQVQFLQTLTGRTPISLPEIDRRLFRLHWVLLVRFVLYDGMLVLQIKKCSLVAASLDTVATSQVSTVRCSTGMIKDAYKGHWKRNLC